MLVCREIHEYCVMKKSLSLLFLSICFLFTTCKNDDEVPSRTIFEFTGHPLSLSGMKVTRQLPSDLTAKYSVNNSSITYSNTIFTVRGRSYVDYLRNAYDDAFDLEAPYVENTMFGEEIDPQTILHS